MPLDDARRNVWELVLRSGHVDVLRTLLGCVDRTSYWLIRHLVLNEVLNIASGTPFMSWTFLIVRDPAWNNRTSDEVQAHTRHAGRKPECYRRSEMSTHASYP